MSETVHVLICACVNVCLCRTQSPFSPLFNWVLCSAAQTQAGSSFRGGCVYFFILFFVFLLLLFCFVFLRVWAHRRIPLHTPCLRFTQKHTPTHTHTGPPHTPCHHRQGTSAVCTRCDVTSSKLCIGVNRSAARHCFVCSCVLAPGGLLIQVITT